MRPIIRDDYLSDYYVLDWKKIWVMLCSPIVWANTLVIGLWITMGWLIFQASYIQYLPDSFQYKSLSLQPFTLSFLLSGERAPLFPVLLKLFKSEAALV